ncbi:hypothetical protein TSUD_211540 [Trifolium subterraneum]|uniref:Era-type G domain-containing protein n=1 Tax=Trifolium subterraneum TaxID=3900 RepID=A0A2Z6MVN5_TRISU|nr:hypothetical protein TSUD_211540 [Trifolium subterraneum]
MKNFTLLAPSSSTSTTQQFLFQIHHSFFAVGFATRTTFIPNRTTTELPPHLCCRTKQCRSKAFTTKQELLAALQEQEEEEEDDDDTSFLSLSMKPDRSLGFLDDYETEELNYDPNHRSGYVALLGMPNVGKSTLANQMVGQRLSIVTDKPQTTRHRILCICSGSDYQMILYDTPGVLQEQRHKLDSMMMQNVRSAAVNADCILILVDACKAPEKIDEVLEGMGDHKDKVPTLLIMNKKDLIKPGEVAKKLEWYTKFTDVDEVIPVSAKYGHGIEDVKNWDIISEHPERFFVAEIIREKIFLQYRKEIPYVCQVNVLSYKARPNAKDFIQVQILVEKNSQKMVVIGKNGNALKLLATAARLDIEDFLQKKVYLEIQVKVKENWRQDEGFLKHSGYGGQIGLPNDQFCKASLVTAQQQECRSNSKA